jgi:hypothetical protein
LLAIKLRIAVKSVVKFFVGADCIGVAAGVATSYLGVGVAAGAGAGADPPESAAYAFGVTSTSKRVKTNLLICKG